MCTAGGEKRKEWRSNCNRLIEKYMMMRLFILIILSATTLQVSAAPFRLLPVPMKWYSYLSIEGRAALMFPSVYEEKKQSSSNGTIISVKCIRNDDIFMFSANVHAIPFPDPFVTAKLVMDNNIRKHNATLVTESEFLYKTWKGKEAVFKDMDGYYYYRSLVIDNIVYQMMVFTAKDNIREDVNTFFKSFEFRGQNK
jgi:hypothetical protein